MNVSGFIIYKNIAHGYVNMLRCYYFDDFRI